MQTAEDKIYIPFENYTTKMVCVRGPKFAYPDAELSFPVEGFTPRYEKITPNSSKTREWKSFEHYKSVSNDQTGAASGAVGVASESVGFFSSNPKAHSLGTVPSRYVGYTTYSVNGYHQPFGDPGQLDAGLPGFNVPLADGSFVPPPADLVNLERRGLSHMLPLVKSELSLPNFILELKDFKRPVQKIVATFRNPGFLSAYAKAFTKRPRKQTFKQLLQSQAGRYLNYKFNIAPLVSDIGSIYAALSRTEKRINDLVSRAGRPQKKHFVFQWYEFPDVFEDKPLSGPPAYPGGAVQIMSCRHTRHVDYDATIFRSLLEYNYNYTTYQAEHARLLGHLDAFGINLNPAIIWNAIPWSFVVDWVVGIGPFLDSLKTQNLKPQINIRRYLWSVQRSRYITVTKVIQNVYDNSVIHVGQLPAVRQTAYRRHVTMPTMSSITQSGLTPEEVSLGAALVISRRRRRLIKPDTF